MARLCPDCNLALKPVIMRKVTVDACPRCAGVFFDEGEINQIRLDGDDALAKLDEAVQPSEDFVIDFQHHVEKARVCPNCRSEMDKMRYLYNSPIVLDSCGHCNGVWVENGELEKMADVLKEAETTKSQVRAQALMNSPASTGQSADNVARTKRLERSMRIFNRRSQH